MFSSSDFKVLCPEMPKTSKVAHVTRGATEHFLIGHHQSSLDSGGKLPVTRKVLQYLNYRQSLPGRQSRPVKSLVCRPLMTNTNSYGCNGSSGCSSGDDRCVVAALAGYWRKAGIPTISDQAITAKILKVLDEWKAVCKDRTKSSAVAIGKRDAFAAKLDQLFDIGSSDAIPLLHYCRLTG